MTSTDNLDPTDEKRDAPKALPLLEMLEFAVRASRRHVRLGLSITVATVVLGLAVSKIVPQKYEATSQILADETFNKTDALSTPDRAAPNLDPFSGSFELLTQKSVLISIIDEVGLLANMEAQQLPWMRSMDALVSRITGRELPSLDEKRDAVAKVLATHITLKKNKNVVNIQVTWPDRRMAFRIAQLTYGKLMELVRNRDAATYSAAISILEDEAKRASEAIEPALTEVVRERDQGKQAAPAMPVGAAAVEQNRTRIKAEVASPALAPVNEAAAAQARQFSAKLAEINSKIQAVEDGWHRQQASLNAHLTELRTVYGQAHPQVIQQQTLIAAAREPPAELKGLQSARTELLSEIQNVPEVGSPNSTGQPRTILRPAGRAPSERTIALSQPATGAAGANENLELTASRAKLIRAVDNYNNVAARLASARLQFAASQATFGMRFVVVNKPELPTAPIRPLRMLVRFAALFAGLLFGFLAGALRDLSTGIVHESAQLKAFGLKDLGELVVSEPLER